MESTREVENFPPGPLDVYRKAANFDWKKMKCFFEDPEITEIKLKLWETLEKDPLFQRSLERLTTDDMKKITAMRVKRCLSEPYQSPETAHISYKYKTRLLMGLNEGLAAAFPDSSVKLGIGVLVFKNILTTLGTERHSKLLDAVWHGKVVAALAMTEIGHGSNTKQMRTTATFDKANQEFVINTPDFEAAKCWVGNLGKTCTFVTLFAQLHTNDQCHGLHAFVVPVRDPKTLLPFPGVVVGDMGEKIGLHGIDNGFIMFNQVRIPRENLLNRTADVTPDGDYESSFSEPGRILGAALENLSTGRVSIMQECVNSLVAAVTISVRYAAVRKQFAGNSDDTNEYPIIEYQLHQWRLFPYVASAAVLKVFVTSFTSDYLDAVEKTNAATQIENLANLVSEIHAIVSCSKPLVTWTARDAIQESREACGGHGFLKAARIGDLRAAVDACVTYEGDNNVLGQQASNWLLRQWELMLKTGEAPNSPMGTINFLVRHKEILVSKFSATTLQEISSFKSILASYEWLITYLVERTHKKQELLMAMGKCKTEARNGAQVFLASALTKAFGEYLALVHFSRKASESDESLRNVLVNLGVLYGLVGLNRLSCHFYEGGYANGDHFGGLVKNGILEACTRLKGDVIGVVDALAPPDYIINSVLGKSDGKLYQNLETCLFHAPGAMARPAWWQEVVIPGAPDIKSPRCKL